MNSLIVWTSSNESRKTLNDSVGRLVNKAGISYKVRVAQSGLPPAEAGCLVLAMGADCIKVLAQAGLVAKGRTVNSLRNQLYTLPSGAAGLVTYAASVVDVDYGRFVDMQCDVRTAIRYIQTGDIKPKLGNYRYVEDFSEAIAAIKQKYQETGKKVVVALDSETLTLNPYHPKSYIVSVQLSHEAGMADVVVFKNREDCVKHNPFGSDFWHQMKWILTAEEIKLRGANLKYDLNWFHVIWGLSECTNFSMDTTIVGSLLDENRSNSLNAHAKLHSNIGGYDDPFNLKYDKSNMPQAYVDDPQGFLTYAGGDTDACLQVSHEMAGQLREQPDLANFYVNIVHPAVRAYEDVERVGWCVDKPYYLHLKDELEVEIDQLEATGREILGGRIIAKHTDKKTGKLNLTKASLLTDFFFSPMGLNLKPRMFTPGSLDKSPEDKRAATSMEHLKMFEDHPTAKPFVSLLKELGSAKKTHETYVVGFMKHLRPDGRFHPTYFFYSGDDFNQDEDGGTVTGRLSVVDPAIQTIPKHTRWTKKLRMAFVAPPGMVIVAHDYSQGELRIVACMANEEAMIAAYQAGMDLHAVTGAAVAGYAWEDFIKFKETNPALYESIRQLAKASNFGLVYGQQAKGFARYAKNKYGVDMSLEEAEANRNAFFGKYAALPEYHKAQIAFAREYGCVVSPLGRIRHLPMIYNNSWKISGKAERQAINSPVQATLSDMMIWATAIMKQKGLLKTAPFFGMCHDQGLLYMPEDSWEKCAAVSKEIMENLPFEKTVGWKPQLKFLVDTEAGPNLGTLKKVSDLCG